MREGLALCMLLCAGGGACGGDAPAPPIAEQGLQTNESAGRNFQDGLYERNVVFMTVSADSAIIAPW